MVVWAAAQAWLLLAGAHLPGLCWRACWHTWHPPPPRPRRPDLELAGACQLPDQNQYTRRLPKFQVQRSPHVGGVGRVRQMGNFWVAMLDSGRPPFRLAAVSPPAGVPRLLAASGAGPCKERPLVTSTSLTLRLLSATLSTTTRTAIRREIRGLSSCLMLPERRKNGLFFHVGQSTFAW